MTNVKFTNIETGEIKNINLPEVDYIEVYKKLVNKFLDGQIKELWINSKITTQQKRSERGKLRRFNNWNMNESLNFLYNLNPIKYDNFIRPLIDDTFKFCKKTHLLN